MNTPKKRRGPIYWLLEMPGTAAVLGAPLLWWAQASPLRFMALRLLPPVITLFVVVVAGDFGILPERLARWLGMATMLGGACVFLMTIRDLQKWRNRRPSDSCSPQR